MQNRELYRTRYNNSLCKKKKEKSCNKVKGCRFLTKTKKYCRKIKATRLNKTRTKGLFSLY